MGRRGVGQIVDDPSLAGVQVEGMQLGEVLLGEHFGDFLEVIDGDVQRLEVLQVLEVRVEVHQSVAADGQTPQLSEFGDVLARGEVEGRPVGVREEDQFVGGGEVLHFERQALFGPERGESGELHASGLFGRVSVHAFLPEDDVVPIVHLFVGLPRLPHVERAGDGQQGHRVAGAGVLFDRFRGVLVYGEFVLTGQRHFVLRPELHYGVPFDVARIDAPIEADGHFARTEAPVEFHFVVAGGEPCLGLFGDFDVEVHVGLHPHVERTVVVGRVVRDVDLLVVERDGVIVSVLRDGDIPALLPVVLVLDAHDALPGFVAQRRVDDNPALGRSAAVGRRNGDPGIVGRGDPGVVGRHLDIPRSSFGADFDRVAIDRNADLPVVVGAAGECEGAEGYGYVAFQFHDSFVFLMVIQASRRN